MSFLPGVIVTGCSATEIYTLSLHDALPILTWTAPGGDFLAGTAARYDVRMARAPITRSEEHTSELQSQSNLVCRLLLEKKKSTTTLIPYSPTTSSTTVSC